MFFQNYKPLDVSSAGRRGQAPYAIPGSPVRARAITAPPSPTSRRLAFAGVSRESPLLALRGYTPTATATATATTPAVHNLTVHRPSTVSNYSIHRRSRCSTGPLAACVASIGSSLLCATDVGPDTADEDPAAKKARLDARFKANQLPHHTRLPQAPPKQRVLEPRLSGMGPLLDDPRWPREIAECRRPNQRRARAAVTNRQFFQRSASNFSFDGEACSQRFFTEAAPLEGIPRGAVPASRTLPCGMQYSLTSGGRGLGLVAAYARHVR